MRDRGDHVFRADEQPLLRLDLHQVGEGCSAQERRMYRPDGAVRDDYVSRGGGGRPIDRFDNVNSCGVPRREHGQS